MSPSSKICLVIFSCFIGQAILCQQVLAQADQSDAALKGHLEETGKASKKKVPALKPMVPITDMNQPGMDDSPTDQLDGQANSASQGQEPVFQAHPDLSAGQPQNMLKGYASADDVGNEQAEDPDASDSELMIEWDRWRNRFLKAVQFGMQEALNNLSDGNLRWDPRTQAMVSRFPMGTESWFYCQITPDLKIVHLKILHPSGIRSYDQAVMNSVDALQGSNILRYPPHSKRQVVVQVAGIKTAQTSEFHYFKFGDVERQIVPGQ